MKTVYLHGWLLDGSEHMEPRPDCTVVTEGDRILSVTPGGPAPEGSRVIDLEGRYLMPGLINLHVHLPGSGAPKKKQKDAAATVRLVMKNGLTRRVGRSMCRKYARTELMSGVTTIRTVGGLGSFDSELRDSILRGETDGPRILASNMAVSVPGGHMAGSVAYAAGSEEEARKLVRTIMAEKPDWIKLMITGGVLDAKVKGEPGVLKMPPSYVKACCEEAHAGGFRVAAHTEGAEGVRVALENGVDTIEHGADIDEDTARLFLERGACDVCTISPAVPLAKFGREVMHSTELTQYNGQVVMDGIIACAKTALAHGIPVGLGTDTACPFVTHYDMWRELWYFQHYVGVTPAFALYTATRRNAEIAGIGGETGSIELGKCADLLVTQENPLENLQTLRTPWLVTARGKVYLHPQVKKIPVCEEQLDRCLAEEN